MSLTALSVVIPTHNRSVILRKTLAALERQSAAKEIFEVLVVDDGSADDTSDAVEQIARVSPLRIRYLRQEQRGQASARNYGLREAGSDLVLFIDDDVIARTSLVAEHTAWHRRHPGSSIGVMGRLVWAPGVRATPFMKWIGSRGQFLNYKGLRAGSEVELYRSYFSNTSVKASFLRQNATFSEVFRTYGFEDVEVAYRLNKAGWKLLYNPDAVGEHCEFLPFKSACERFRRLQRTRTTFETTEAGIHFRRLSEMQKASARYRLGTIAVRAVVPPLAFMKPLMDSRLPLPWPVYAAFYHYYKSRPE